MQVLNQQLMKRENTINESIVYARTLQNSLIHTNQEINELFDEFYDIDLPKNILGGDYYWYYGTEQYVFVAMVDCTGHGIPGSILSVISNLLLKKIIIEKGLIDPEIILSELHVDTINALSAGKETIDDGMEIALIRYNKSTRELTLSQTAQSILVVNQNGQVYFPEINGFTIGGYISKRHGNKYSSERMVLEPNSWIYLFTDGIVDQFNEQNNEKFGPERLIELVSHIYNSSPSLQLQSINHAIYNWKGKNSNTDDITLLGLKFK